MELLLQGWARYEGPRNEDGLPHGTGVMTFENEDVYEGDFVHGFRKGRGILRCSQFEFNGAWHFDQMHGEGSIVWHDLGERFDGNFHFGAGTTGIFTSANGIIFEVWTLFCCFFPHGFLGQIS